MKHTTQKIPIILVLSLLFCAFSIPGFADDGIVIMEVKGNALYREVGDYLWKNPEAGQGIYAGDNLQVRHGEALIDFPQGSVTISETGRIELPVDLVDGFSEPWDNELILLIGNYAIDFTGDAIRPVLKITTAFVEIEVDAMAKITLKNSAKANRLSVIAGTVTVRHRWIHALTPKL